MKARIEIDDKSYLVDYNNPISIAIPLRAVDNPNCYFTNPVEIRPNQAEGFIGSIEKGGPVNHMEIRLSPHGNGTHTECSGHIYNNSNTIDRALVKNQFLCKLITVTPEKKGDNSFITERLIRNSEIQQGVSAVVIRTLPNSDTKLSENYSGTNPTYIDPQAVEYLVTNGVEHLIVDIPSVDPEVDEGRLAAHKSFWGSGNTKRRNATITELAYIPNHVIDGLYLLNLQVLRIELDVSPSNPILYSLSPI